MENFQDIFFNLIDFIKDLKIISNRSDIYRYNLHSKARFLILNPSEYNKDGTPNIFYGHNNEIATFIGYLGKSGKVQITGNGTNATVIQPDHNYNDFDEITIEDSKYFNGTYTITVVNSYSYIISSPIIETDNGVAYPKEQWSLSSIYQTFQDRNKINVLKNKLKFQKYYKDIIYQKIYDSNDNKLLFENLVSDWYGVHKTIAGKIKSLNNPYEMAETELDERFKNFGFPLYNLLSPTTKINFLLDLVNLYKIKGSPRSVYAALQYFFGIKSDIYEFWLNYDSTNNNLYFRGYPSLRTYNTNTIDKSYNNIQYEPHWYYTKTDILNLINSNDLNLPSMTPFITLAIIANFEETRKAYLYISYLARLEVQQWNNIHNLFDKKIWNNHLLNEQLSIVEIVLAYSIIYNELHGRFLPNDDPIRKSTYNPDYTPPDFEQDYEDSYEILDETNTSHDMSDFGVAQNTTTGSTRILIDSELPTNSVNGTITYDSCAIEFQSKAYVFGGVKSDKTLSDEVWSFDLYSCSWNYEFNLPIPLRNHKVFIENDDFLIFSGITTGSIYNTQVIRYNVKMKQWDTLDNDFPINLIDFGFIKIGRNEILIFGGYDLDVNLPSNSLYKYNFDTGVLTTLTPMPNIGITRFGYDVNETNNEIIVNGGINRSTIYNSTYKYNIPTDTWSIVNNSQESRVNNIMMNITQSNYINCGGHNFPSGANISGLLNTYDNELQTSTTLTDKVKYYLKYIDLLYMIAQPVLTTENYNSVGGNWNYLQTLVQRDTVYIDYSSPYVKHINHNIICLQPLLYMQNDSGNLIPHISDKVFIKEFLQKNTNLAIFSNNQLYTPNDPNNLSIREQQEDKLANREHLFSLIGKNVASNETDNKTLLQQINPTLYNNIMTMISSNLTDELNKVSYSLLSMLDDIAAYYNIQSTFKVFGLNYLINYIKEVIDFFKPIHTRYLGVGTLIIPFKDRVDNTWAVDDRLRMIEKAILDDIYSYNDNLTLKMKMEIEDYIQWSYNFNDDSNYLFDRYTIYENLVLAKRIFMELKDTIQWSYNFNDQPLNIFDEYTIYENAVIKHRLKLEDNIQFASNFNDEPMNLFDRYTIYDNLVITERTV